MRRENRRLLVFVVVATLLFALAAIAYHGGRTTPAERAREQTEHLREKVRDLTHGK